MKHQVVSVQPSIGAMRGGTAGLAPRGKIEGVGLGAVRGVELDIPVGQGRRSGAVAALIQHCLLSLGSIGQVEADGVVASAYSSQVRGGSTLASIPVRPNPIGA